MVHLHMQPSRLLAFLLIKALLSYRVLVEAFVPQSHAQTFSQSFYSTHENYKYPDSFTVSNRISFVEGGNKKIRDDGITLMKMSSFPSAIVKPVIGFVSQTSSTARNVALLAGVSAAVVTVAKKRQSLLWPRSSPDPDLPGIPLPKGSLGCPFVGVTRFFTEPGFRFFPRRAAELGNPKLWKMYLLGRPVIQVVGSDLIKPLLQTEFETGAVSSRSNISSPIFGDESLIVTQDAQMHSAMRQLVGASMTPSAISDSLPTLETTAKEHINILFSNETTVMDDLLTSYTLDIAWRQIIGLDLNPAEAKYFQTKVNEWIQGIISFKYLLYPSWLMNRSTPTKAYKYLTSKVEDRIAYLEANGPDKSTLSALLFAREESEDGLGRKKLSHQQVVDNALLLILAGSETSASTLTNCMLNLGINRDAWQKVKEEQQAVLNKYDTLDQNVTSPQDTASISLTRRILDRECPYLEAVIKETMRIKPISAGSRSVRQTQVVEGYQIPKGWAVNWNIRLSHQNDPKVRPSNLDDEGGTNNPHMEVMGGFKPERWLSESTKPSEFLSFGAGPRYCIGASLAMAEMKVFLASLARQGDFQLVQNIQKDSDIIWRKRSIIPKPEDGVVVRCRRDKLTARMLTSEIQ